MNEEMKEALKQYLKENLTISVDSTVASGFEPDHLTVSILIDGEFIASDTMG